MLKLITRRLTIALIASSALISCSHSQDKELRNALNGLDKAIDSRELYEQKKQERLQEIKSGLKEAGTTVNIYAIYDRLYEEYYQYNIDSAIFYANLKLKTAQTKGLEASLNDALLDIADRYILSGMYMESSAALELIRNRPLSWVEIPRQLHLYHAMYEGLESQADDPELRELYKEKKEDYCRQLYDKLGDDDVAKLFVHAEILHSENRSNEAVKELLDAYEKKDDIHTKAILAYSIAKAYRLSGQNEPAMLWLARSAKNDISTPVHEYRALGELAALLYERGDIKRAYKYITCSLNDAIQANARINIQYLNEILPFIAASNTALMRRNNRILLILVAVSLLVILLICIVAGIVISDRKRIATAEANLRKANERLERYIAKLQETNNIKETYIGQYMDFCSDYIGRLDKYRLALSRTLKSEGVEEVRKELRSTDYVKAELEEFYTRFDKTFLSLFPTFVEQLNELLQPDKRIALKSGDDELTTELRVYALLRLGVQDSVKIAEFLRRSVTTVYNYRVKMRNAALNSREDLEKQIMKIR